MANFIYTNGGDVTQADQHNDDEEGMFFQRVEFRLENFRYPGRNWLPALSELAQPLDMRWSVRYSDDERHVAVLVSRQPHCLVDLLGRWHAHELPGKPVLVASNHAEHADLVSHFGLPYYHLPVSDELHASLQESSLLEVLAGADVELVILARYMRILSPQVIDAYRFRVINIHHSFLPAFSGGRPLPSGLRPRRKIDRRHGALYETAELDEGPIIEQDTARVSHRDGLADLARTGRDLETVVLARAVRLHLSDRVLVYGHKTVVF